MRAAGIRALGEPVEVIEVALAAPASDEVLIDVAAAGVGNWDELVRIGSWPIGGPDPMALGTEAAGTVAAAGSGVAELLAHGTLSVPIASVRPLEQAAQALREVVAGADGAIVLSLRT